MNGDRAEIQAINMDVSNGNVTCFIVNKYLAYFLVLSIIDYKAGLRQGER
jgi:hypothetical protein